MEIKNVLLISPHKTGTSSLLDNLKYLPLGIATLASILQREGYNTFIYDGSIEKGDALKNIIKIIHRRKINVVGLSFTSNLAKSAYYYAERLKQQFSDISIIAGGYHPTVMAKEVANHPAINYVVVGEGEITLLELLKGIENGGDIKKIRGLCFSKNGEIITTPHRPLIQDIDNIPIPDYGLLKLNNYNSLSSIKKPFITMIRSRGCPYNCLFCGVEAIFSRQYRCQSPERTLEEVIFVVKYFKIREIVFKDSDFLINIDNVKKFCELLIKKNLEIIWSCSTRVDRVNKNILKLMKQAGCRQITFGIESGSEQMLKILRKNTTVEQIIEAVRLTKNEGISCVGGFIIGTPGENFDTINETIKLFKKINLDYASFNYLTAFPGSDLYEQAIQNKWFIGNTQSIEYEKMNINATKLSEIELRQVMKKMIRTFYFRPAYILKRFVKFRANDIRNNLIGLYGLLTRVVSE